MRGSVEVAASPSAAVGFHGTPSPQATDNIIDSEVFPVVNIRIAGVGEISLSPGEVRALLHTIDNCREASPHPQNYVVARTCRKSL